MSFYLVALKSYVDGMRVRALDGAENVFGQNAFGFGGIIAALSCIVDQTEHLAHNRSAIHSVTKVLDVALKTLTLFQAFDPIRSAGR